jgi:hypothetical protein
MRLQPRQHTLDYWPDLRQGLGAFCLACLGPQRLDSVPIPDLQHILALLHCDLRDRLKKRGRKESSPCVGTRVGLCLPCVGARAGLCLPCVGARAGLYLLFWDYLYPPFSEEMSKTRRERTQILRRTRRVAIAAIEPTKKPETERDHEGMNEITISQVSLSVVHAFLSLREQQR